MSSRKRNTARALFLGYLGLMMLAAFMAVPLSKAFVPFSDTQQAARSPNASAGASAAPAPQARQPITFDDCDRDGDGMLDKSESARVPGLSANFERADTNQDGKLDREEFDRAVAMLATQAK